LNKPTAIVADDHQLFVEGLCHIVRDRLEVVAAVSDGRALVAEALERKPDLVIADISMPLLNGIDAVRQIRRRIADAKILLLTMHPDLTYAIEGINAGAMGYVLKHALTAELLEAVDRVLAGRRYVSPDLAERVEAVLGDRAHRRVRDVAFRLTPRQREVLQLIAEGHSAKEVADILCISPRTAEFHKRSLREGFGVRTTAELIQQALKLRLLDPDA
jgi:DNA-binding NarL/FixJ family response regulator